MARRGSGEGNVRQKSDGRWEARYYDPREPDPRKQRKYITLKRKSDVISALKKVIAEIDEWKESQDNSILSKEYISQSDITLSEWIKEWMETYKFNSLRDSTYETYNNNIRLYIDPKLGHIKLQKLTSSDIQIFFNNLQLEKQYGGSGLSSASAVKIKNVLSGALRQAMKKPAKINYNPLDDVNSPKEVNKEIRIMNGQEQEKFSAALPFYNAGNLFAVMLATGMRVGEIIALEYNDINRDEKYIVINKTFLYVKDKNSGEKICKVGPPKTAFSNRKHPLLSSVEIMLDRQLKYVEDIKAQAGNSWIENNLVFPSQTGTMYTESGLRTTLNRICDRAQINRISLHSLRHTYTTNALNSGIPAHTVANLIGHKDGATTLKIYAHYLKGEAISQLSVMEERHKKNNSITEDEMNFLVSRENTIPKESVSEMLGNVIKNAKNQSPQKGAEMIRQACIEIILSKPVDEFTDDERKLLITKIAQSEKFAPSYERGSVTDEPETAQSITLK